MRTNETNPHDWLFLARERLRAVDALYQAIGTSLSGVELLQESVERFLKAFLISQGWKLKKIHNLATLLDYAIAYDDRFKSFAELSENLTAQFWAQHYPGDDISEIGADYEALRSQAEDLIHLIENQIQR